MTGKIILHTAGSFFETGMGFWIFSKVFPRRKRFENRHLLSEVVMYTLVLFVICLNFLDDVPVSVKLAGYFIWVGGLLFYRCYMERQRKMRETYIRIMNRVLGILAVAAISSLLAWNGWIGYISVSTVIFGNLFVVPFLYFYYRCSLIQAYLYEVLYSGTVSLVRCAYLVYVGGIDHSSTLEVNSHGGLHNYRAILFSIIVCVVFWFLVRSFSAWKLLEAVLKRHRILAGMLAAGESVLLYLFTNLGDDGFKTEDVSMVLALTLVVIVGLLLIMIRIFTDMLNGEKQLLDVRNEAVEQQYRELRSAYERNRCLLHDEKHMLQYMEACLENNEIQKAREFAAKCQAKIIDKSQRSWTGIPTLDFMINMKKRKMDELLIEFHLNARVDTIPMDDADFVVLMGNLFDNAIEAAKKCTIGKREIMLSIKNVNDIFLLQIQNTSSAVPTVKKERFITSKSDPENHGWGIKSARHIVEKYNGDIHFTYDAAMFQVCVMIETG